MIVELEIKDCSTCPFVWMYVPKDMYKCSREGTFDLTNYPEIPLELCPFTHKKN